MIHATLSDMNMFVKSAVVKRIWSYTEVNAQFAVRREKN